MTKDYAVPLWPLEQVLQPNKLTVEESKVVKAYFAGILEEPIVKIELLVMTLYPPHKHLVLLIVIGMEKLVRDQIVVTHIFLLEQVILQK